MLTVKVPATEQWNEITNEFVSTKEQVLTLEHSLISVSKWESHWCKPFLSKDDKTVDEQLDYIKCMTISQNVDQNVYKCLTQEIIKDINDYIAAPMSATFFREDKNSPKSREQITSELIYYWMIALEIPFECQRWHLNRLLTLIRVCEIKSKPPKKRSQNDLINAYSKINEERRKRFGSKG